MYTIKESVQILRDGDPLKQRLHEDSLKYLESSCRLLVVRIEELRLMPRPLTPEEEQTLRSTIETVIEAKRLLHEA